MLLAAGVSLDDPMLPTIFYIGRVADCTFNLLESIIQPHSIPQPSRQLFIEVASRAAQFSSWSDACETLRETLVLINVDKEAWTSRRFTFKFEGYAFEVEVPLTKLPLTQLPSTEMPSTEVEVELPLASPQWSCLRPTLR